MIQNRTLIFARFAPLALALLCGVAICGRPARAESPAPALPSAYEARVEKVGRETRLRLTLSACIASQAYVLDAPARAIVDLPEVDFLLDPGQGVGKGRAAPALSYRFGRLSAGRSRIVIDLPGPMDFSASCVAGPGRSDLVLSMKPVDNQAFRAAARAGAERQVTENRRETASPPAPASAPAENNARPLIVLDPGHGGVDAGTIGHVARNAPPGAETPVEKNVVLDFAKALAAPLRASGRYRVAFTREDDTFVPLQERVRIARKLGASLLVSLHADALRGDSDVRGATVYTVSDRASDVEAARVAEAENKVDALAGQEEQEQAGEVNDILFDLTRRETRVFSNAFANYLKERWKSAARLNKNPRRFAGFVVLKAPDVPSVLLELGYLSSEEDAADLTSPQWREKAAAQVARAIDDFFAARAGPEGRPTVTAAPKP